MLGSVWKTLQLLHTLLGSFYDRATALDDMGKATDTVYLDLNKASDTAPHDTLVSKMER